jgi:hypothetical protein
MNFLSIRIVNKLQNGIKEEIFLKEDLLQKFYFFMAFINA